MEQNIRLIDYCLPRLISVVLAVIVFGHSEIIKAEEVLLRPGSLVGDFKVTSAGAATYSIPIQSSPGTAGMQPSISIDYSSQSGQSVIGKGWSIGGLSLSCRSGILNTY